MSSSQKNRQPKGIPVGGQFAASAHAEAQVGLDADPGDPADSTGGALSCSCCGETGYDGPDDCSYCEAGECGTDHDQALADRLGVSEAYPNGRCQACGSGLDDGGSCYQPDCSRFDPNSDLADDTAEDMAEEFDDGHSEPIFEFQVPGSSATYEIRRLDDEDQDDDEDGEPEFEMYRDGVYVGSLDYTGDPEDHHEMEAAAIRSLSDRPEARGPVPAAAAGPSAPSERPCFGCTHQHDPASSGPCYEADCLPGCTGCATQATLGARDAAIAKIEDSEVRAACETYADRYALPPVAVGYEPEWTSATTQSRAARDVVIGDRLHPTQSSSPDYSGTGEGQVVTGVTQRHGVVYLHTDGNPTDDKADLVLSHGDPVSVHSDRVDPSDPDWFEVESSRIAANRFAETHPDGTASTDEYDDITREARRTLTRVTQPTNISPLHHDGRGIDPRTAHGRAKVGDNIVHTTPMYGDTAYEVLGKRMRRDITGHDGINVTWGERGDVDYVVRSVESGATTVVDLRGPGWLRVPAPGDYGPGAQAQALR